jgi:imidazoleglycerol-phosphate dehydratase/histidinol-phosphatase
MNNGRIQFAPTIQKMKKVLFIDRDGVLVKEPNDYQVDDLNKLQFYPGVFQNLSKIAEKLDFVLVMVTNQDGLGTDSFPEDTFWPCQNMIINSLKGEGIEFTDIFVDRTFAKDNAPTRKPGTGMLGKYMTGEYDLANSFVIGDRITDMQLAANLGAKGIWLNNNEALGAAEITSKENDLASTIAIKTTSWKEIWEFLRKADRTAVVERNTKETKIKIEVDLDGSGKTSISTGLPFFDHMLDQIGRHSGMDLTVLTKGDLEIDEHHTIEDTALALGECINKALGNKLGVERYGYCLPMDDCLAQVAIDFGGRPWIEWSAEFKREKVGDMPTEMFYHFFKSFSDTARCNLNIKAEGTNEHHKIEGIFKALAKAIKMAIKRDADSNSLPSTKGVL